jgi:aminopeptidase-like protein
MTYRQFSGLDQNEKYHVVVDSDIKPGSLTYGEYLVKGKTIDEVLVSCHVCHPSLCNDNLSGIIVSAFLANFLSRLDLRFSYRFLFIPGTIGSIVWLSRNQDKVGNIKHGLVLTLLGDNGKFHYKKSRLGNSVIDKTVENLLKKSGRDFRIIDFYPYGYDERQFCSPGFNLPVGRLSRTPHGEFPEYHTSADNLSFIKKEKLGESFEFILNIFSRIESNEFYINLNPFCEPQLGKKGLYKQIGGQSNTHDFQMALLWVLNLCDGNHSLPDISDISGLEYATILDAANKLMKADLLKKISFE